MRIPSIIGALGIVVFLGACSPTTRWDEGVRLSTGQVLTVRRTIEWARTNAVGDADTYGERVTRLSFRVASGQVISWSSVSERALILDYDTAIAEYFIVTAPIRCTVWQQSGRPRPPYFEYRLRRGKKWQRVSLAPSQVGRAANLLLLISHSDPPVDVDLERKRIDYEALLASGALPERMLQVSADAQISNCS